MRTQTEHSLISHHISTTNN